MCRESGSDRNATDCNPVSVLGAMDGRFKVSLSSSIDSCLYVLSRSRRFSVRYVMNLTKLV